jgi:hypothetical protein
MIALALVVLLLLERVALFLLALLDLLVLFFVALVHARTILVRRGASLQLLMALERGIALLRVSRVERDAFLRLALGQGVIRGRRLRRGHAGLALNLLLRSW